MDAVIDEEQKIAVEVVKRGFSSLKYGPGDIIAKHAAKSLRYYLDEISKPIVKTTRISSKSRAFIEAAARAEPMKKRANEAGVTIDSALQALWERPVLFSGPHTQLIADVATLPGYLTAYAMAQACGVSTAWMLPCSTLKMQEKARIGPGWLRSGEEPINIFGISGQQMRRRRVCSVGNELSFRLVCSRRGRSALDSLTQRLSDLRGPVAAGLFHSANSRLFNEMTKAPKLIAVDEQFAGSVLCRHVMDGSSLAARLLLDQLLADKFQRLVQEDRRQRDPRTIKQPTEHLWLSERAGQLVSLRRRAGHFLRVSDGVSVVKCDADSIVNGISEGFLVPNLFMTYLVLGFLPAIRLAGGARQPFYMENFDRMWRCLLDRDDREERELLDALPPEPLNSWAYTALEVPDQMIKKICAGEDADLGPYVHRALETPLAVTSKQFAAITRHDYFQRP